jgi:hypothetical protein
MTQPSFVPITEADHVRPARRLQVPAAWSPDRPAELRSTVQPHGAGMGTPGPDQGYALGLARRLAGALQLSDGESEDDVLVGAALLASKRAGLFGRAPSIHDLKVALGLFGFLGSADKELVDLRRTLFAAVSHGYPAQRSLVDAVPEAALRLPVAEVTRRGSTDWRSLLAPVTPTH